MSLKRVSKDHCFYGLIHIDVTSRGEEKLCRVFQLFVDPMGWGTHPFKPTGYRIDDGKRMTIFESEGKGHFAEQKPFPFDSNPESLAHGCLLWLKHVDYGSARAGHEGAEVKGWRCYNDSWENGFEGNALAIIEPAWILLGK